MDAEMYPQSVYELNLSKFKTQGSKLNRNLNYSELTNLISVYGRLL